MTATTAALSPGVHAITLDAGGVPLSALRAAPPEAAPRATVVALHGAGLAAGYFDGQADPSLSLLTLGAHLGFTVIAVDRPGYGASAARLPDGQTLAEQAGSIRAALADLRDREDVGAGLFLVGHSFGGKLALQLGGTAADDELLGIDVSGCGHRYVTPPGDLPGTRALNWGVLGGYPPSTFRLIDSLVTPAPVRELQDAEAWPTTFAGLAARIRVPLRFTFAEHESWWRHDPESLAELTAALVDGPAIQVERLPHVGHNISLSWAARAYHLRALGFLEECLWRRAHHRPTSVPRPEPTHQ